MKKWIGLLVFLFSMQAFSSSLHAAEYKVIEQGYIGSKNLSSVLNKYSKKGWKVNNLFYKKGKVVIIFEK